MKRYIFVLATCLSFVTAVSASDTDFAKLIVGKWSFAATNPAANQGLQWISKVTKYAADGTFEVNGTYPDS